MEENIQLLIILVSAGAFGAVLLLVGFQKIRPLLNLSDALTEPQRLARLLVSELALYNQDGLEESIRAGTVTEELRSEIDRAYAQFEERTSPAERRHFSAALEELLGGGKTSLFDRWLGD